MKYSDAIKAILLATIKEIATDPSKYAVNPGKDFSPLCLKALHSKKYDYIVQEVWARAILHNFSSEVITNAAIEKRNTKHEYQANFSEGFKTFREFLRIHDETTLLDVEGLIAQNIEPIRPGRTIPRRHRFKLSISFCYRN
ncbi:MAG: hypothetical protein WCD89_03995 [Anaerocolumna sp.]